MKNLLYWSWRVFCYFDYVDDAVLKAYVRSLWKYIQEYRTHTWQPPPQTRSRQSDTATRKFLFKMFTKNAKTKKKKQQNCKNWKIISLALHRMHCNSMIITGIGDDDDNDDNLWWFWKTLLLGLWFSKKKKKSVFRFLFLRIAFPRKLAFRLWNLKATKTKNKFNKGQREWVNKSMSVWGVLKIVGMAVFG